MAVGAQRDWELVVERGACGKLLWSTAKLGGGVVVGAQREWECIVGQRGVWEAAVEYGGGRRRHAGTTLVFCCVQTLTAW